MAGSVRISVSFSVSAKWLGLLTGFKQREKISVDYFDMETLAVKNAEMFLDGYKAGLVEDTFYLEVLEGVVYAERILVL